ncbi:hypothetical protein P3T36_002741 [Kitasatospora sp. MAP12-15]|uniref:hypothetical protein n=1 Tax=unclassified Kitasatospora TaxID=2633591 RepID=UPI002475ADF8|nr:hypothetical protein [Kitasatospora sp. MAP12-44]MDH6113920.1 hypothetical protein [Kitasatospora sp. MAP12-44]MDH6114490.1 hypothetical protein [Kitasatospora sp. MAP12-44]
MSILSRQIHAQRQQARIAVTKLTAALTRAGSPLPSVGIDPASALTGTVLVDLGRARSDVVIQIAELILEGLDARDKQQS